MFKVMLVIGGVLFFLLAAFVVWRWTSVRRGMRERDEKLVRRLDSVAKRIENGEAVSPGEIDALAKRPENRFMLFAMLREMKRPELIPSGYSSSVSQGESALAYWLMHPNEAQDAPEAIELVETVKRSVNGEELEFYVYRYKMPPQNWEAKNGWMLGLTGPMRQNVEPYSELPGAFARGPEDVEGKATPQELVDWYLGVLRQGMIR